MNVILQNDFLKLIEPGHHREHKEDMCHHKLKFFRLLPFAFIVKVKI